MLKMSVYDSVQAELAAAQTTLDGMKENLRVATDIYDMCNERVTALKLASEHLGRVSEVKIELASRSSGDKSVGGFQLGVIK